MIICGLDQAPTGIGFAHGEPGARPTFGYHHNPDYSINTSRLRAHVRQWVAELIRINGIERVYFEQIVIRAHNVDLPTLHKQFAVVGGIETACELLDMQDDVYEVLIADWRREFYFGRRRPGGTSSAAWKEQAKIECARRGWLTENHNTAEALGIWHYGCICSDRRYRANAGISKRRAELQAERGGQ